MGTKRESRNRHHRAAIYTRPMGAPIPAAFCVTAIFVSPLYREIFQEFSKYFLNEMEAIGDETLNQELEILKMLSVFEG